MNDLAADAFEGGKTTFEVGSVIIKEKLLFPYRKENGDSEDGRNGVGGMIKRPVGFDAEHGDWEYLYFEVPEEIESGRIASCIQCHSGAKTTDYVFASWRESDE
jgi:hypothetical protein